METERNWADLHPELLGVISDKLVLLPDYIRFGAVCKSWLCVIHDGKKSRSRICSREPPLLLIPTGDGSRDHRCLYSIWEQKVYPHRLPIPYSARCCGSSFGWWAVAEKDMSITLLDPFSGTTIHLPPILVLSPLYNRDYVPEFFLHKVVLSCDPSLHPNDWVVAAIHHEYHRLAFIRSGDESWSYPSKPFYPVQDACFYGGLLYALADSNALIAIDVSNTEDYVEEHLDGWANGLQRDTRDVWRAGDRVATKFESIIGPSRHLGETWTSYLVDWEGDFLLVRRIYFEEEVRRIYFEEDTYAGHELTLAFKVYKLSHKQLSSSKSEQTAEWVEIHSLGNFSLFLGDNMSLCVSAANLPNCQPNCIYFMDDCQEREQDHPYEADDFGICNMENGQISKYYTLEASKRYMPPVVWISPKMRQSVRI